MEKINYTELICGQCCNFFQAHPQIIEESYFCPYCGTEQIIEIEE